VKTRAKSGSVNTGKISATATIQHSRTTCDPTVTKLAGKYIYDRFSTTGMGRKEGVAAVPLSGGGAGSPSNTMWPGRSLPPCEVSS